MLWARERLTSVGCSSSRPVRDAAGDEDRDRSRRVEFRATVDARRSLDEPGEDVSR